MVGCSLFVAGVGSAQVGKEINGSASCDRQISWQKYDNVRGAKRTLLSRKRRGECGRRKITISILQWRHFAKADGDSAIEDDVFVKPLEPQDERTDLARPNRIFVSFCQFREDRTVKLISTHTSRFTELWRRIPLAELTFFRDLQ